MGHPDMFQDQAEEEGEDPVEPGLGNWVKIWMNVRVVFTTLLTILYFWWLYHLYILADDFVCLESL